MESVPDRTTVGSSFEEGGFVLDSLVEQECFHDFEDVDTEREIMVEPPSRKLVRHQYYSWNFRRRKRREIPAVLRKTRILPGRERTCSQRESLTSYLRLFGGSSSTGSGVDRSRTTRFQHSANQPVGSVQSGMMRPIATGLFTYPAQPISALTFPF